MGNSVSLNGRSRSLIYQSFLISLCALIVGVAVVGFTASAANYSPITSGSVNWTAVNATTGSSAVWSCSTVGAGDSCGIYPGQIVGNPFVDNANVATGSALTIAVTSSIPAPVTVNLSGFGDVVDVGNGGTLALAGNSAVTSTGGSNTLSVSGGTLALGAGASLGVNGVSPGAQFTLNGGSVTGSGSITMSQQGIMNVTGTQGPVTTGNLLNVTNNSTINYNATTNGWTLNGALASTGTFNDNGSASISGGGSINNSGVFQKGSGAPSTVNVPFNDSGTVSITSTSGTSSIDFSAGGNISGPFNFGVLAGSSFLFAGTPATPTNFNAGASFSGNGDVTFHGSRQNVNTTLSLPGNFINNGNTFFGGATQQTLNVAGTFTQAAAPSGSIDARLFNSTTFDKVAVTGTAALSGNLNETVMYSPSNGDTFQPVTFSNNGGTTFQAVTAANPNGVFLVTYPPSTAAATALQLAAVSQADIMVQKTAPATLMNGQNGTWNLSIKNNGPSTAGPVVLSETFNNALFVSSTPALCSGPAAGPLTCTIPTLGIGATQAIAIVLKANSAGTITNTLAVSSTTPMDPINSNDSFSTTTTVTAASDLSLGIAGAPTASASSTVTYTATVSNGGPDPVTPSVNLSVSSGTISGASGTGFTCTTTTTTASCTATGPMASAGSTPITLTVVMPAAPGTLTVTGSATPTANDPNPANNNASLTTTVTASADLQITKSGPPAATAGQNIVYTIIVKNIGPSDATGVSVTDTPPAGTTFVANAGACTTAFPCSLGTVTAGSTVTMTSTYAVASSATGSLTNAATVTSSTSDPTPGNNTSSVTTPVSTSADLSIIKSLTSTLTAGTNATYSIVIMNSGPSDATGVTVTDPTPPGMTFVSNSGACTTAFPCSIGTLTAGSSASIVTTYAVAPTATGPISNTANVSATTPDPSAANNSSTATGTIGTNADVSILKTVAGPVVAGQNVTFTITVKNSGPSDATSVTVTDTPGAGLTFVGNSGACATAFPCSLGTLTPGQIVTFNSTFKLASSASGSISNTAMVSTTATDSNPANNSATASSPVTQGADLAVSKSGPAAASPGQTINYTVSIVNNGPSDANSITVTDPTPANLTFVSNSGACTTPYPCAMASLPAGATAIINSTYTVNAAATGTISNTVSISSAVPDPTPGNNSATATTTVTPKADLSITKTGPATIPASGQITFAINVKNAGPSTANNVFVNDSPGPGLTFMSNAGACTTPFPCSFATLAAGGTITIQSTFKVSPGSTKVTNSADVNSSTFDPNNANNSATITVGAGNTCPSGTLTQFAPFSGQTDAPTSGLMQWTNVGASTYEVYLGAPGSGCSTLVATVSGTSYSYSGLAPNTDYESRIIAVETGCPSIPSQCIRWRTTSGGCNLSAPVLQAPPAGTTVGGTTTLMWGAVAGATSYHVVVIVNGVTQVDTTTPNTSLDVTIPNGSATWSVTAISGNCTSPASTGSFNICAPPAAPVAGVVGAPTSGNAYAVIVVVPPQGAVSYEFQEATDASFGSVITQTTNATSVQYSHTTNVPEVFFYRVRATGACTKSPGPFSKPVRVVIVPGVQDLRNPKVNVPAGNKNLVVVQVLVPGDSVKENFAAFSDRPWIVRIDPSSGILPPEGITLNVAIDPSRLPNGTFTATVIVSTSPINGSSRLVTNGTNKSVPVSINLVTPVVPVSPNAPTADSIFIPAVGHLAGLNSQWRSDIRIYNASPQTLQYQLNFTPQGSTDVKQTTITTLSGDTTALDDIIHNWFGVGEVGDSSTGVLEIRPMTTDGSTTPPKGSAFTTVASSRTFNATSDGTVGQFIPPVAFSNFIGSGSRLSMQQLAQTQAYRTNFGLLEGSGAPVSLVLSMFDSAGTKLFDMPVDLAAGEQKLFNGLLAEKGLTLNDGRMEVSVAGGDGKVTAYASVIDNASLDPQLVPGQNLTGTTSKLYVVPGVADLNNGVASWRTDMRIYNSGGAPQSTGVAFYPQANSGTPLFATLTVNPNEVKVLDSVLQSLFATHDVGGMVQVTTPGDSQLVVTARTYNQTANGTLGQFIKAATAAEGITTTTRALNILQVEDSPRFRTNVGVAEMTGKPATVEVSVILPDSKVTPSIQVPLAANEFRQFGVAQFGLGNVYNARVSVRVIDGAGSVTAYGSVIDQVTTDPTYVQAQ